jgi:hypothetical protein
VSLTPVTDNDTGEQLLLVTTSVARCQRHQ